MFGALGVVVLMVLFPSVVPNHGDLTAVVRRLRGDISLFAAFTTPPRTGTPGGRAEPGLLRFSADGVVVIQTNDLRIHYDGRELWEDGVRGHFQHDEVAARRFGQLAKALRKGLRMRRVRPLDPGELPEFLWSPGTDLFQLRLNQPWAKELFVIVGIDAQDGGILELTLTDEVGRTLTYEGRPLRASFGRVEWDVPLGPDMVETQHVPLHQLGARTVFQQRPPGVARDLPFYERVQHHPMAFVTDASQGVKGAHGEGVLDVLMPTVWCDTAEARGRETARLVFGVDPAARISLDEAVAARCAFSIRTEPKTAHVATQSAVARLEIDARVRGADGTVLWESTQSHEKLGAPTSDDDADVEFRQPQLRADLPAGTSVDGLRFEVELSSSVQCRDAGGKGRVRTYLSGISQPRLHWRCPTGGRSPTVE